MLKFPVSGLTALTLLALSFASMLGEAHAVERDCAHSWLSADADKNGVLERGESGDQVLDAAAEAKLAVIAPGKLTREEFLAFCSQASSWPEEGVQPNSTSLKRGDVPIDRGKGDLTPGRNPFSEDEARRRLEAVGYKNVGKLTLDDKGIWRGSAGAEHEQPVGIDAQGDIISQKSPSPK